MNRYTTGWGRKTARAVPRAIPLIAAATVVSGSSAMNGMFGLELAKGMALPIQIITVAVIVGIDWLKPFAPAYIARAREEGDKHKVRIGQMGLTIAIILSLTAAIGFSANLRSSSSAERQARIDAHRQAKANHDKAEAEITAIGTVRPASALTAKIDGILIDSRSEGCKLLNGPYTRKWCPVVTELKQELAKAQRKTTLEARRERAAKALQAAPPAEADPQAARIAWLISFITPVDAESVQNALVILVAIGIEFFAAFGFEIAGRRRRPEEEDAPDSDLPIELQHLYKHLALHKDASGQVRIRQDKVGSALGVSKSTVNGRLAALVDLGILRKISADRRGTLLELVD